MQIAKQRYGVEPVSRLTPHPKNSRRGDLEAIEASMAVNGFFGAVIAQEGTGLIVVGNHRFRAASKLGATEIPVIWITCSDVEAERMALADNKTHDLGAGYDTDALLDQLNRIVKETGSTKGTGFSKVDMAALSAQAEAAAAAALKAAENSGAGGPPIPETDDGESISVPAVPVTRLGDIWVMGEHRLMCGDSLSHENRLALLGSERADLVLTDPPYAIFGSSTGIAADIADDKMIRPFFEALGQACAAIVEEFAHIYVCCDWRSYATIYAAFKLARLSPKNCIVWDKGGGLGSMYANAHEWIAFFAKLPPPTTMKSGKKRGERMVNALNIMKINRVPSKGREHNAAKPLELFERLIENSSDPGALVFDFCLGSGTTVIAAEKLRRRCFGFELEPRWCDYIVARWEKHTGAKAQRVPREEQATS